MICPICKKGETSVVDSRPTEDGTTIRRRRLCICGERFTTFERVQFRELMVVKKNGRRVFFLILNPYNFVPLTAHIKLEINYSNELEHKCSQEVSLMALNDTFTFKEMDLDTKNLSYDIKSKELEAYWHKECEQHPSNNHCKIFCD